MRVVLWHGWLLEGSGSNVYTARVSACLRRMGHDVLLVCQERHPERYDFLDAWGMVSVEGISEVRQSGVPPAPGRCMLLRPNIGTLLPVFVVDEYEGFLVKRFVDLTDGELDAYLERNVEALRAAVDRHGADVVITGHAIPGAVIGRRAVGAGGYVAKVHGSDLEYAIRPDERYRDLAREGLTGARAIIGAGDDVLDRTFDLVPEAPRALGRVVPPGVEDRFRPMPRNEALRTAADALESDPDVRRGRPAAANDRVRDALARRDAVALAELATSYDQEVPDPGAAAALRSMAGSNEPTVGYLGKLIPQKGVHLFLQALCVSESKPRSLVIGFGGFREWLHALLVALAAGDVSAVRWIADRGAIEIELTDERIRLARGVAERVVFTGRLDHRYAPGALAALDVLVVPSLLEEAFGMVAVEGAAAGAIPLVARHSGLAEIAGALESEVPAAAPLSFEPGTGAVERIAAEIDRRLGLDRAERDRLREEVSERARDRWSWDHTARLLLEAGGGPRGRPGGRR